MRFLYAAVLCSLFCLFAGSAFAATVPEYDIKSLCAKEGAGIGLITQQCLEDQREAKARIKRMSYTEDTLQQCRRDSEELDFSYMILEQCLKDETFAKTLK